jgi:hypothetical protein
MDDFSHRMMTTTPNDEIEASNARCHQGCQTSTTTTTKKWERWKRDWSIRDDEAFSLVERDGEIGESS